MEQDHEGGEEGNASLSPSVAISLTLSALFRFSPGPSRLDDLPRCDAPLRLNVDKAINGKLAQVCRRHFCPHLSRVGGSLSSCPHPERSRSSRPIQKCPVITDLSVVIFINNRACDDPAGMLMSPQLELISCRRCIGRLSNPPTVLSAAVKCTLECGAFCDRTPSGR